VSEEIEGHVAESPARTVFRHSLMTFGTRIGIVLVNIPTSILVARLLGTEGQGTYTSAIIFPTMFAFIGLLGVDSAHTFLLSKKRYHVAQINGQSVLLACLMSLLIAGAYLLFLRLYPPAAAPGLRDVLLLATALIPVLLAKYLSVAFLLGLQKIKRFNLANLLQAGSLLLFMCLNLLLIRGGTRGAIIAYLLSEITVTLLTFAVAKRVARGGPLVERPPRALLRESIGYGLRGHFGNILVQFTYRFDMFLVLSMVGLSAQGLYSISVILAEKLSHIPRSVQVVLFPKLSSLSTEEANDLTPRVVRNSFLLTVMAGAALFLLSRPLLLLFYGTPYLPALQAFRVLIPGVVALSISTVLAGDFSGRDRRLYHTVATAIGFAVNIVLCFFWIPRDGIVGAAWASTVAYTLQALVLLGFFRKLSGRGLAETIVIQREDLELYARMLKARFGG